MHEIALKVLFSKSELFLIRNQHKPFVLTKADVQEKDGGGSEEDSSDWEPNFIDIEDPNQPFIKTLCRGLYTPVKGVKSLAPINESKWYHARGASSLTDQTNADYEDASTAKNLHKIHSKKKGKHVMIGNKVSDIDAMLDDFDKLPDRSIMGENYRLNRGNSSVQDMI